MQNYILCEVSCDTDLTDFLIAELGNLGYEGFIETDTGFEAYLPEADFKEDELFALMDQYGQSREQVFIRSMEQQNWNEQWESSFEPVTLGSDLRIRAPFHPSDSSFPIELIIQPKTSFGTGHHETTYTIMELMLGKKMNGLSVLDYGSGTGILAVLAGKLQADKIFAIDIDDWASENIFENAALNGVENIEFVKGDLSVVPAQEFDVILANINKNILISSLENLLPLLKKGGTLFLSGFYENDLADIFSAAEKAGFIPIRQRVKNNWAAAEFTR